MSSGTAVLKKMFKSSGLEKLCPELDLDFKSAPGQVVVSGLVNTAKSYFAGGLKNRFRCDVLIIVRGSREEEKFLSDIASLFPDAQTLEYPSVYLYQDMEPSEVAQWGTKAGTLHRLYNSKAGQSVVVASVESLYHPVPSPEELGRESFDLEEGLEFDFEDLAKRLEKSGYKRCEAVSTPGDYSLRGSIADIYPAGSRYPVRLSFFGDEIESMRLFDPQSQKSVSRIKDRISVMGFCRESAEYSLLDYFSARTLVVFDEYDELVVKAREIERFSGQEEGTYEKILERLLCWNRVFLSQVAVSDKRKRPIIINSLKPSNHFTRDNAYEQLKRFCAEGFSVAVSCNNEGEMERLEEILKQRKVKVSGLFISTLDTGVIFPSLKIAVITDQDIFGRYKVRKKGAPSAWTGAGRIKPVDIEPGEYVVHLIHGIGKFLGFQKQQNDDEDSRHMVIEYRDQAKLYVPSTHIYLVEKYMGVGSGPRDLDKLGSGVWRRKKEKVRAALMDVAAELLEIQAKRQMRKGHAFSADTEWQVEFEKAFLYEDTVDQKDATIAIKEDMENPRPMDRLICGDVGFGKTEVAIRAAFKCVMDQKQVAVLVPTTILAYQHYRTFSERMADYPVKVEMLSRFRTRGEQKNVLKELQAGTVDIVIGTHRLLQKDLKFKDLGLLIIDEEQRFGVKHKEKFKKLRSLVDILTITATPIPRTLYMALTGIREMSTINTPPRDRLPVKTKVISDDPLRIQKAIEYELLREGQVFFLHNRVHDIHQVAAKLQKLVPNARIAVGHGQMHEHELEKVVQDFVDYNIDVLVCTTIIESGVDIPNANTIIINNAWKFGLAELYQIRGRVGRYRDQAYAYLIVSEQDYIPQDARERLQAIREYNYLGSGYKIALKDLEIRGSGNILGEEQSGHIAEIGFDLYCKLLKENVLVLKGQKVPNRQEAVFYLGFDPFLPSHYIPSSDDRLEFYKRIGNALTMLELNTIADEMVDRFGPLGDDAVLFLDVTKARMIAQQKGVRAVDYKKGRLIAKKPGHIKAIADVPTGSRDERRAIVDALIDGLMKLDISWR